MENQAKTKTSSEKKDGEKQSPLNETSSEIPFPDAVSFVETDFLDTPFGSPDNWKCSQCGAIIHANFYSGDDCPACGATRMK